MTKGGRPLVLQADTAEPRGWDGAVPLLKASWRPLPLVDCLRRQRLPQRARRRRNLLTIDMVRNHPEQVAFAVHPRRWMVERLLA